MSQSRRLVAIMFTDIVGYTALMEQDEQRAFEVLKRNLSIHQSEIKAFGGRLIKELGDGILASFLTVSDALSAAIRIQEQCNKTEFKLSIGIHQGEVVFENGDIFGDAVNVASRIQSLGTPGSILFSKKVADEMKNKIEFHVASLGSFEFKNINEPIEVFALANDGFPVPRRNRMQGKLKKNFQKKTVLAVLVSMLFVVSIVFIYGKFISKNGLPDSTDKSIAVLPFEDMSPGHDQEYFSDGISEEIIHALVKIDELKVPSRTSSFQFKGKKMDLMEIGAKLNVALILEGSVRKSGDQLRITAQLIDVKNGLHVWSETYNHNIKDIFKAQDEVTRDIMNQLRKRLGVLGTIAKRRLPTQNLEAYDLYLKGHQQFLLKGTHVLKAQELLKEAVRLDPDFAMAHAALAEAYSVLDLGFGNPKEALASAYKALSLDSMQSSAYAVIAWIRSHSVAGNGIVNNAELIHSSFERAIKLDPQNSTAHLWYGITYMHVGLYKKAIDQLNTSLEIDPLVPINHGVLGWTEFLGGLDSIGYFHLEQGVRLGWAAGNQRLAFYHMEHGEWEKAEYYFNEHARLITMSAQLDYHQLVTAIQGKDRQTVRRLLDSFTYNKGFVPGFKSMVYYLAEDYERCVASLDERGINEAMRPSRKELRKLPGFRAYIEKNGFVGYWKKYGWPEVCFPVAESDFDCN